MKCKSEHQKTPGFRLPSIPGLIRTSQQKLISHNIHRRTLRKLSKSRLSALCYFRNPVAIIFFSIFFNINYPDNYFFIWFTGKNYAPTSHSATINSVNITQFFYLCMLYACCLYFINCFHDTTMHIFVTRLEPHEHIICRIIKTDIIYVYSEFLTMTCEVNSMFCMLEYSVPL